MIVERGYEIFERQQGQIVKWHFTPPAHGCLSSIGKKFVIEVDKNEPLELQVITVIHELAHIGREFDESIGRLKDDYAGRPYPTYSDGDLPAEVRNDVEDATIRFYEGNSPLLDIIRNKLQQID